jgi:NTE family protein
MVVCWPIFYLAIRYASQQLMIGTETWNSIVLFLLNGVLSLIGWAAFLAALLYLTIVAFQTYHYVKRFSGFASLAHATEVIDELLAQKIPEAAGRRVTFDDVKRYKGKDLKIVATNIHTGSMTLFDCQKFGQLPVSDAVAASAAIPVAFQPISIGNSQYCDGGLVSNLPAWTFDSERLIDEETHVITSELSEVIESENPYGPPTANPKRGLSLVEAVARATAFGASDLNTRGLQDHISLNLDPTIGMLDFENTRGQGEAIVSAKEIATVRFQDHITEIDTIRLLQEGVKELLRAENFYEPRLRTALIREVKLVNQPVAAYEIWKTQNFEDDFDNRLLLPPATSLAGKSINLKEPKFYDLTKPKDLELYHSIRNKKLAQKVLPDDRKWVISIPFDRESKDESGYPPRHLSVAISFDGAQPMNGRHEYFVTKLREYVKENSMFRPY